VQPRTRRPVGFVYRQQQTREGKPKMTTAQLWFSTIILLISLGALLWMVFKNR
jgi:hypothetical protein